MTNASKWANEPLTFENMRKRHSERKSLKYRLNHRMQQVFALRENGTGSEIEQAMIDDLERDIADIRAKLKGVRDD